MLSLVIRLAAALFFNFGVSAAIDPYLPDSHHNATGLIATKKYPLETHHVQTKDGYILTALRIPGPGPSIAPSDSNVVRPPVLLMHGLLDSCATWVVNLPHESLAFRLADQGYDVWLGNVRGTDYSLAHVNLTTKDAAFWDFSFDEMARYDLPAFVDYVLGVTGQPKLGYVGHSQGSLIMFTALTQEPQSFKDKVAHFSALGPVTFVGHQKSMLLGPLARLDADKLLELLGTHEVLVDAKWLNVPGAALCRLVPKACEAAVFLAAGFSLPGRNFNLTRMPVYIYNTPQGTSVKNIAHWSQLVRRDWYRMFDYGGTLQNERHYGRPLPPEYHLANATGFDGKIAMFTGSNDVLANPTDALRLISGLPAGAVGLIHNEESYEHVDYTWGLDAHEKIYPLIEAKLKAALAPTRSDGRALRGGGRPAGEEAAAPLWV